MAESRETRGTGGRSIRMPAFLKEPLEAAQERLEQFEEEAQRLFKELMDKGRASRKDLEQIVARLSRQDWTIPELKHRLERLREQGAERAEGWRTEAMERLSDLQARAVAFLGVASRDEVRELSREIDRLARRIERSPKPRRKRASRPAGEA